MKKLYMLSTLFLLLFVFPPMAGHCTTLPVPTVYPTVQAAINASVHGDTVLVDPGYYFEHINLNGKNIVLGSLYLTTGDTAYIGNTILDGNNTGRVITINQGEYITCRIIGFTIQHGNSYFETGVTMGGGVYISNASPQILHCVIQNNIAPSHGGGLCIEGGGEAKVMNCTIRNNTAESNGGGVFMGDCFVNAEISNSIITGNTITCNCNFNGGGGGVSLYHTGRLVNCLITNNSAPNAPVGGGGVFCDWGEFYGSQRIFLIGCTIANNSALDYGGTSYVINGGEFQNCIIWGNTDGNSNPSNYNGSSYSYCCSDPLPSGTGNISLDPDFVNPGAGNFRLLPGSPCIDAGNNAYYSQPLDLDGNARIFNVIDMGAYEFGSTPEITVQIGSGIEISDRLPIYSCYGYSYSQQLYLGSEISSGGGSPGFISKIRFLYSSGVSGFSSSNDWTVFIGNTSQTELTYEDSWIPLSSMTQVFSGIISDPVEGNWLEITLSAPFYYSGENLVVAVDENSDDWDCSAEWRSFTTGSPRGLLFYDDNINPDPAFPPDANEYPYYSIPQLQLVMGAGPGILEGYVTEETNCTDPIEGATISSGPVSTTSNASGFYRMTLPSGTYTNITASYGDISMIISPVLITSGDTTLLDFCLPPYFPPPVDLQAEVYGPSFNHVNLTWLAPGSIPDQYIYWGNETLAGSLGYGDMAIAFSVANRWPVTDIAPYDGTYLKKIRFFPTEGLCVYTLKVWKGADAATLLYSQVTSNLNINAWNDIALTTPVLIDGTDEFWFGYEAYQTEGYPAGLSAGPAVAGKGDMINSGLGWISMKDSWNFDFNWLLQGFISESPVPLQPLVPMTQNSPLAPLANNPLPSSVKPQIMLVNPHMTGSSPAGDAMTATTPVTPVGTPTAAIPKILTGYNLYKDNVKIADNIPDLFYNDLALPKGGYDYQVSAQYDVGESARIGPAHINIYSCFPPANLTVSNATLTTTSADLLWTPSTLSPNPQWILEWGLSGFVRGAGNTVVIATTPGYSLSNLNPGAEYDFYVRTYCSSIDSSAWVKKTFRTHYLNCPPASAQEAELCGDTANNGCLMPIPAFEAISCGDTICGSAWLKGQSRDTDWYSFTLTETTDVTVKINAEFSSRLGIKTSPCPDTGFIVISYGSPGWESTAFAQLNAGTYYVHVAPTFNGTIACDSLNRYILAFTCSTCLTPTALGTGNTTNSSAYLQWTSNGSLWDIEWGPAGFTQGTGTMISGTPQNPYLLSGLTEGYSYSYYVRTDCGGGIYSFWAGPYNFFVPCPALLLPYYEDFTSQNPGNLPLCWQARGAGSPINWFLENNSLAGGQMPEITFTPNNSYFNGVSYLMSPLINTTGRAELTLSFNQYKQSASTYTSVEVMTTSDGGNTWNQVWYNANAGTLGPENTNLYINNPDVGSANFQFAFVVNGNSWDINTWAIDDINLDGMLLTGILDGYVYDCNTNFPAEGVLVTAGVNSTYTDNLGYFLFDPIPAGTYDVICSKTGYETETLSGVEVFDGQTTGLSTCLLPSGPPEFLNVQNITLLNGQSSCYDATQTITVAGNGSTFIVNNGGSATLIAGFKISYLPGTWVQPGGYMLGKIATGGPWCGIPLESFLTGDGSDVLPESGITGKPTWRVYPNPTTGKFKIDLTGFDPAQPLRVEIFGMHGALVLSETISGETSLEISLTDHPSGIYFIRMVSGETLITSKVVKAR